MCGIIGIIGTPKAAMEGYLGLLMLQHRGQDSAGLLSFDHIDGRFCMEKNLGHVKEAIDENNLKNLPGLMCIGHTRYSTIGKIRKEEIQPMVMNYPYGLGMVHNGNLINYQKIKTELLTKNKRMLLSKNDLEIMMNLLAENLSKELEDASFSKITKAVSELHNQIKGGYSGITLLAGHGLLAFKDPKGIRPLVWGKRKLTEEEKLNSETEFAHAFASESNTLNMLGYEDIIELQAGEIIYITKEGKIHQGFARNQKGTERPCMFEWIYFANADSTIWNQNIYQMRLNFGSIIGEELKAQNKHFDIVVPVPDTSRPSTITISEVLKIPYREVLIKNRYSQRTFILNSPEDREKRVKLKLNVVREEIKDKKILLVDDSIVRGTTSKRIIKMLLDNGAKEVSIASTCPPIVSPCFYGIDFPDKKELMATDKSYAEIANAIGAKEVFYMSEHNLKSAFKSLNPCMACINGNYPVDITEANQMIQGRIKDEAGITLSRIS